MFYIVIFMMFLAGFPCRNCPEAPRTLIKSARKWQDNASLNLEYILGIKCESRISEQEWVLSYYNPLHLEDADNKSFYIVNAEGVITAYYPREQYRQMMDDIRRRAEDDVYGKVAAQVRADKRCLTILLPIQTSAATALLIWNV